MICCRFSNGLPPRCPFARAVDFVHNFDHKSFTQKSQDADQSESLSFFASIKLGFHTASESPANVD
jgi:hypothetical protein